MSNDELQVEGLANSWSLSRQFRRLGWAGFYIQAALFAVSVSFLLFYLVSGSGVQAAQDRGIDLGNYVSFAGTLIMLFTTLWCFGYTRLAGRLADPDRCPPRSSVMKVLWVGVGASAAGILWSMVLTTHASLRLLFVLLATPKTGVPVVTPLGSSPGKTISAIDALALTALQITLAAELIVMAFSLWLLFRVTRSSS
jgi:Protein of unknown function (DUF3611)